MGTTTHLMSSDELFRLPDDGRRYELVKGELLTMPPPPGFEHATVTANITILLGQFVQARNLGRVCTEGGFLLEQDPDTVLAPDFAFIRKERLGPPSTGYYHGAPDLVVEVLSPGDRKSRVEEKLSRWLALGVSVVWLINSKKGTIEVRTPTGVKKILSDSDLLTGDDVVPGFSVSVSSVFR